MFFIKLEKQKKIYYRILMVLPVLLTVFAVSLGRQLSVEDFGILNVLIAVLLTLLAFCIPVEVVTAKFTAGYKINDEQYKTGQFLRRIFFYVCVLNLIVLASGLLAAKDIGKALKINNEYYIGMIFIIYVFFMFVAVLKGHAMGVRRYFELNLMNIVFLIVSLLIGLILVSCKLGIFGFFIGIMAGVLVQTLLGFIILMYDFDINGPQNIELGRNNIIWQGILILIISLGISIFMNIDILTIKHFYSPKEAGLYAVASLLPKAGLLTFILVVVSKYIKLFEEKLYEKEPAEVFKKKFLPYVLCALVGILASGLVAYCFEGSLFGDRYNLAVSYVIVVTLNMIVLCVFISIALFCILKRRRMIYYSVLIGIAADIFFVARINKDVRYLLIELLGVVVLLIIVNITDIIAGKNGKALKVDD